MITSALLCCSLLALFAAVVVLAPKVINSNEGRSRIEAIVAKELNCKCSYSRAELKLLPRSDVVLYDVSIVLPGTLSAPVAVVRVHARLFPLFQARFAVSSVALERPDLSLTLKDDAAQRPSRKSSPPMPGGNDFDKALAVTGRELPDLSIKLLMLDRSLPCLFHKELGMTGVFDLSAQLTGKGTRDMFVSSLVGAFVFTASDGMVRNDHVVKGIIAYLNSTSQLKGSHSNLLK